MTCYNNIIIVRGINIESQVSAKLSNEGNGQGKIVINLSQDTENMLFNDIEFLGELQSYQ